MHAAAGFARRCDDLARRLNTQLSKPSATNSQVTRAPLVSLFAAAALAVAPAAALAQDAGGGQYKDPLTGGGGHSTPAPTPGPTASAGSPSSGASAAAGSSSSSSSSSSSATAGTTSAIPRTGFPVGMLMFAGALLLCGGLALRRVAGTTHP